jgi:hypothetical protein
MPSAASVFPPQQPPEAQPRGQFVVLMPLPSGMHSFSDEPSQDAPWPGVQALQRVPLQPLAQASSA